MERTNSASLCAAAASRKLSLRGGKRLQPMPATVEEGGFRSSRGIHTLVRAPESQPYLVVDVRQMCGGDLLRPALSVARLPNHRLLSCCHDATLSAAYSRRDNIDSSNPQFAQWRTVLCLHRMQASGSPLFLRQYQVTSGLYNYP